MSTWLKLWLWLIGLIVFASVVIRLFNHGYPWLAIGSIVAVIFLMDFIIRKTLKGKK